MVVSNVSNLSILDDGGTVQFNCPIWNAGFFLRSLGNHQLTILPQDLKNIHFTPRLTKSYLRTLEVPPLLLEVCYAVIFVHMHLSVVMSIQSSSIMDWGSGPPVLSSLSWPKLPPEISRDAPFEDDHVTSRFLMTRVQLTEQ